MFKEPGESSPDRVSEKVERAAAAARSRIRRERTVREFQPHNPFAERGQIQVPDGPANDLFPRTRTRTRVHVRQDEEEEQRTLIESLSRDDWGVTRSVRYGNEDAVENSRRRQAGEELLRDALQYQRPGQRMRVPRSPRTSALRFEVAPAARSSASPQPSVEEQTLLAGPYMPSHHTLSATTVPQVFVSEEQVGSQTSVQQNVLLASPLLKVSTVIMRNVSV
jgi:hypothetical protein